MKIHSVVLVISSIMVLPACISNQEDDLQKELNNLSIKLSQVEAERDLAFEKIEELETQLNELLVLNEKLHKDVATKEYLITLEKEQFEKYKFGNGVCVTRYWKDIGRKTICGADNLLTMYEKGYCPGDCNYKIRN